MPSSYSMPPLHAPLDTCPIICPSCGLASLLARFALSPRLSSLRSFAPFLVSSSGAMSYLRACAAYFSCPCDVIKGRRLGRAACLMMSGDAAMSIAGRGSLILTMVPTCVCGCGACPMRACLAHPIPLAHRSLVSTYCPLPRRLALRPVHSCRWAGSD